MNIGYFLIHFIKWIRFFCPDENSCHSFMCFCCLNLVLCLTSLLIALAISLISSAYFKKSQCKAQCNCDGSTLTRMEEANVHSTQKNEFKNCNKSNNSHHNNNSDSFHSLQEYLDLGMEVKITMVMRFFLALLCEIINWEWKGIDEKGGQKYEMKVDGLEWKLHV